MDVKSLYRSIFFVLYLLQMFPKNDVLSLSCTLLLDLEKANLKWIQMILPVILHWFKEQNVVMVQVQH